MAENIREHTLVSELERYIGEIISMLEQGGENGDFVHFCFDHLCTIIVQYVEELRFSRDVLREIVCQQEYNCHMFYDVPVQFVQW